MENNDIELFCTTNVRTKEGVVSRLVNGGISYLEKWERIPFFRRKDYNGAKELCVIYVNANQYDRAAGILDLYRQERSGMYGKTEPSDAGDISVQADADDIDDADGKEENHG